MSTIVVGVDGSEGSRRALRWALEEARLRQAVLEVVHAWTRPRAPLPGLESSPSPDSIKAIRKAAKGLVDTMLADFGEVSGIDIRVVAVEGPPAAALLEASRDADLLVLGSRGRGGFTGLLLGSVSQQCAHHVRCPILIVPPPPE